MSGSSTVVAYGLRSLGFARMGRQIVVIGRQPRRRWSLWGPRHSGAERGRETAAPPEVGGAQPMRDLGGAPSGYEAAGEGAGVAGGGDGGIVGKTIGGAGGIVAEGAG